MKEVVVEGNIVTVKYETKAYWAVFKSPVMATEVAEDIKKHQVSETAILNSPFKFREI